MDHSTKNNASKPVENRLPVLQSSTTMSSFDPLNHTGNIFRVDNMSILNPAPTPLCADLLGNMEESKSRVQVRPDNNANTMNSGPLLGQIWTPQIARSPFYSNDTKVSGVNPQNPAEEATVKSYAHGVAISSAETMHFSSLFDNNGIPQIDLNTMGNGVNAEFQQQSLGESTPGTDIASIQISRALGDSFMSVASQYDDFRLPQITRDTRSVGGGTLTGDQIHIHGEAQTDASHFHGGNSNNEIMFPSLFSNYYNPQNERSSGRVGSNTAQLSQLNSWGGTTGTSQVQSAISNVDSSTTSTTQLQNLQRLQVNKSSRSIGVKRPATAQPNSQVKTGATRSHMRGGLRNSNVDTTIPILFSNNLRRGRQSNKSPISIEGGVPSTSCANSQDQVMDGANLGSNAILLNAMDSSITDRDFLSVGGSMPDIRHYQIQENQTMPNHAKPNEVQSSSVLSQEQTGSSFLNLGFGGNTTMGHRSDDFGRGVYSSNEYPVTRQSQAFNGNFLSLGGDLGNQTWSDNANTVNFDTNAVANMNPFINLQGNQTWSDHVNPNNFVPNAMVNSHPYTSLQGNLGNQTLSNNGTSIVLGTNIGNTSNSFTNSQTVPDNGHTYIPRPSGRTLLPRGNGVATYANADPYKGFTGHSGVTMTPFNSIPAGLHANEQARVSNLRPERISQGGISNEFFSPPPQQALNNVSRISTTSSMTSMLNGAAAARTSRKNQPGTRVPAQRIQYPQSPKVHLGPSVSGTPVPMARHAGFAQASETILRKNIQSGNVPSSATTFYAPRGRKVIPSTVNPTTLSASQTNAPYHVKWKGPEESFKSTGDKCLLCKRDLTYTATGPVFQPSVPPATAVLPCGHTFHDECLQRITPEDQLKNPPCIPCAIGPI